MAIAHSKVTARGQISVPAEIRKRLDAGPGAILEWDEKNGEIVVRRARHYTWDDVRSALFPDGPPNPICVEKMDDAIRQHMRKKHARR